MRNEKYCVKHNRYHRCRRFTVASGQKRRSVRQTSRVSDKLPPTTDSAVAAAEIVMQVANTNLINAYDRAFRRAAQGRPASKIWATNQKHHRAGRAKYLNGRSTYSEKVGRKGVGRTTGLRGFGGLGRRGHAFEKVY